MPVTEIGDPRLQALFGQEPRTGEGVLPSVRPPRRGLSPAALIGIALALAVLLFVILNGRRTQPVESDVALQVDDGAAGWAPPPLYVPPAPTISPNPLVEIERPPAMVAPVISPQPQVASPQIIYQPQPAPELFAPPPPAAPPRTSAGAPLVIDTDASPSEAASRPGRSALQGFPSGISRVRASNFANRSMTVPQGYLIPAVLESGFNSTEPGFARAIVSRDVRGFDGKNVLIPRGSRLIGEYRSNVAQGQRRAVISWTRLIRPDGRTIALNSPAVDTLGRGGVTASVNNHFFARFGDALLQSTIGIGSAIAGRAASGPVVIVPQNAATATAQMIPSNNWVPTLTVPAGKSISVFVAQDLDFGAEGVRQ